MTGGLGVGVGAGDMGVDVGTDVLGLVTDMVLLAVPPHLVATLTVYVTVSRLGQLHHRSAVSRNWAWRSHGVRTGELLGGRRPTDAAHGRRGDAALRIGASPSQVGSARGVQVQRRDQRGSDGSFTMISRFVNATPAPPQ